MDLVKALIKNGANVNLVDNYKTALRICIMRANYTPSDEDNKIFDTLLDSKCDLGLSSDVIDSSPLISCIEHYLRDWAWKLLPLSDLGSQNSLMIQPIHAAVQRGLSEIVAELIKRKVELNNLARLGYGDKRIMTACHFAVIRNDPEILKLLLDGGANPHIRADNTSSPGKEGEPISAFIMAADLGREKCFKLIVDKCPPTQEELNLGFNRYPLTTSLGKKSNLSDFVEAKTLQHQLPKIILNGVNFSVNQKDQQMISSLIDNFFIKDDKEVELYHPIWKAVCSHAMKNNDFSIIFSPREAGSLCGKYNAETTSEIIIYYKNLDDVEIGGTLIHEMAHKCEDLIYKNYRLAPKDENHPLYDAIKIDLKNLPQLLHHSYGVFILEMFTLDRAYPEFKHPSEYIVRIPQVIFSLIHNHQLSSEQVSKCMKNCLPNLFNFYITEFLPACKQLY